jgi:hypothetical protein
MTKKEIARIRADYASGLTLCQVARMHSRFSRSQIRIALDGFIRRPSPLNPDPSEEEVALRRDEINRRWTPEQAAARWVGRYVSKPEALGSCLSRAIRAIGGDA